MLDPALEEMLDKEINPEIESKFELINMISQRARQVNNNAEIATNADANKPVSLAMWEIYDGMIKPSRRKGRRSG
ncbi:MAG: DNA-directed RNA polymerase subunit omega [Vulcanimicrobiota bacterium]